VSVLTGIHRKDIARVRASMPPTDPAASDRVAYGARVIGAWRRERRFLDKRGRPVPLPFDGESPSFVELVRDHGGADVPGRAVLDELVRVGAVTTTADGRIKLVAGGYVPTMTSAESFAILGTDVADLVATMDHNLVSDPDRGFFQRKVAYDNLPAEALEGIRTRVRREGAAVLEKIDRVMSRHDRDANPKAKGTGRKRAMVGVYYYEADVDEDRDDDSNEGSED
jgi:hypothetical protein